MTAAPNRALMCLMSVATLALVSAPTIVQAQEPIPLPPEGEELVGPIGSDACATAGFGAVIFASVVVEGGLDPSTGAPITDAVGTACKTFSPPDDTVACPADDELQIQIFALPTQEAVPLPPPPVTIFGVSIETLRAIASLADQSPDSVNPVADLLNCTTIPGRSGTPGPLPPPTPTSSSTTTPPPPTTVASNPTSPPSASIAPAPLASDEVAVAPAPTVPSSPAPASFTPFAPTLPPEAQLLAVVAALVLLAGARWAWRRAGHRAVASVAHN